KREKRLVDVRPALVAHLEAPEAIEPRERALDHPPISPEALARVEATPRNPRDDSPCAQRLPAPPEIIALVRMQFLGALARSPSLLMGKAQRRDRIDGFLQQLRIMGVRSRHGHRERQAPAVDYQVALRPQLATIGRVLARGFTTGRSWHTCAIERG